MEVPSPKLRCGLQANCPTPRIRPYLVEMQRLSMISGINDRKLRAACYLAAAALSLTGCVSPEDYETEPVRVQTPQGVVTCQLYTRERVLWDRAIHRPDTMSVATADQVCIAEGNRRAGLS